VPVCSPIYLSIIRPPIMTCNVRQFLKFRSIFFCAVMLVSHETRPRLRSRNRWEDDIKLCHRKGTLWIREWD
jgi:hypothetical protein